MIKNLTCIVCPIGCQLTVELDENNEVYIFYLHPFEVSNKKIPYVKHMKPYDVFYLHQNRYKSYLKRIEKIINLLIENNFEFITFNELKDKYK